MTNKQNTTGPTRPELIGEANRLVGHLFRIEKDRLDTRATLADIAEALVNHHGMSIVDAAGACGMTRQRLAQELRIRDLLSRQEDGQ